MGLSRIVKQCGLVLVLVLVIASTTGEPLTGENVCHRTENYTATWSEPYEESVQVLRSTWCMSVPPKCLEPHTEIRTHWRNKTEVRTRNVTECCNGFTQQKFSIDDKNNFIIKCVNVSMLCPPGFIGKHCDKECPKGSWGIHCREACNCSDRLCNPITGSCQCPPGWTGSRCLEKCQAGKWGPGCEINCSCAEKKNSCHHETGNCIDESVTTEKESGTNDEIMPTVLSEVSSSSSSLSSSSSTTISTLSTGRIPADLKPSKKPEFNDEAKDFYDTTRSQDFDVKEEMNGPSISTEIAQNSSHVITTINKDDEQINSDVDVKAINSVIKVGKSTSRPIVTVVHVSGQSITGRDKMIVTPVTEDKNSGHTVPLSLDIVAIIVIGSIMSLSLTVVVVLALYHMRTKLFESIRLSIYDAEKLSNEATLTRQKFNDEIKFQSLGRNSRISSSPSDYETPRCIIPDRSLTLPRTISTMSTLTRESTYSNQFPNIQLFNSPRELLEAHYDRPPATNTFRQLAVPGNNEGEHLYDEIPLQSTMLRNFHQTFQ